MDDHHAAQVPRIPGVRDLEPLGSGGMGTVFRGYQEELGRWVAVKTLLPHLQRDATLRQRFTREARLLAKLEHPGVVTAHSAGEADGQPYYLMRYVEGRAIDQALEGRPWEDVARTFQQVAQALHAAHLAGILHRDVKPANVLVDDGGQPVLVDFGLSKAMLDEEGLSRADALLGTPDYLAPEVVDGQGHTAAADVYALGVSLYRVLTGCVPFPGEDLFEKLRAIRELDPVLPRELRPQVPLDLQAVCLKAMERAPADRYPTAEALAADLGRVARGEEVGVRPRRAAQVLRRRIERHFEEHETWARQGLISERQRAALQQAHERLFEQQRSLVPGARLRSGHLPLLAGIVSLVFGPTLLQLIAWPELGHLGRVALPGLALLLLLAMGLGATRAGERRRGLVCLLGAALLVPSASFALVHAVPALQAVTDEQGLAREVGLRGFWGADEDGPAWRVRGQRLLEIKLLVTSLVSLAAAAGLFLWTRGAALLWAAALAGGGGAVLLARLVGWGMLPDVARWSLGVAASLGLMAIGAPSDVRWRRERAHPFYGLGLVGLLWFMLAGPVENVPAEALGLGQEDAIPWSLVVNGALLLALGLAAHARAPALARQYATVPLTASLLWILFGLWILAADRRLVLELALVGSAVGYLVLGLALGRNALVVLAVLAIPAAVGAVSQHHVGAVWAWSLAVIVGGAALVSVGLRTVPGTVRST